MKEILEDLQGIVEMLISDRGLVGPYQLSSETKRYSENVQSEIQDIISKHSNLMVLDKLISETINN